MLYILATSSSTNNKSTFIPTGPPNPGSQFVAFKCDLLVKIPMIGKINSLNASVAGGIMMYEVLKGRLTK